MAFVLCCWLVHIEVLILFFSYQSKAEVLMPYDLLK